MLALLARLVRGRHVDAKEIRHVAGKRFTVRAAEPVPSHLDGEVQAPETVFEIELLPWALRLL